MIWAALALAIVGIILVGLFFKYRSEPRGGNLGIDLGLLVLGGAGVIFCLASLILVAIHYL